MKLTICIDCRDLQVKAACLEAARRHNSLEVTMDIKTADYVVTTTRQTAIDVAMSDRKAILVTKNRQEKLLPHGGTKIVWQGPRQTTLLLEDWLAVHLGARRATGT